MQRILVVLPNWFGETLFVTPFLRALRRGNPAAFIVALGVPRCQEVLAQNPDLNAFVTYDERGAHRSLRAIRHLIAQLRSQRFDTAFILRRSLTRTILLTLAGLPRRIGFANLKSGWLLTDRVQVPSPLTHKAHAYFRLLEPVGLSQPPNSYRYVSSEQERAEALALLRDHGLPNENPIVVLHPGANWPHKRWLPERFAELANRLMQQRHRAIVITGSPEDQALAQQVASRMQTPPIDLVGKTTLRRLAACLEQASLVVSNDTGVLHVASAIGRPVVALYGPTSPTITGPLGDPGRTVVIHHPDCCPKIPCFQPDHPGYLGMAAISVEEVHTAAEALLQRCQP